jgi:hypothetical protein
MTSKVVFLAGSLSLIGDEIALPISSLGVISRHGCDPMPTLVARGMPALIRRITTFTDVTGSIKRVGEHDPNDPIMAMTSSTTSLNSTTPQ